MADATKVESFMASDVRHFLVPSLLLCLAGAEPATENMEKQAMNDLEWRPENKHHVRSAALESVRNSHSIIVKML